MQVDVEVASESAAGSRRLRDEILAILGANAVVTLSMLRERLGLGWGTVYAQVESLRSCGEIETAVVGRRHLVFSRNRESERDREIEAIGLLRGRSAQRIAHVIVVTPSQSVGDLSAALGVSERVVYYHVRRMMGAGLLLATPGRRRLVVRPTPLLLRLMGPELASGDAGALCGGHCNVGPPEVM